LFGSVALRYCVAGYCDGERALQPSGCHLDVLNNPDPLTMLDHRLLAFPFEPACDLKSSPATKTPQYSAFIYKWSTSSLQYSSIFSCLAIITCCIPYSSFLATLDRSPAAALRRLIASFGLTSYFINGFLPHHFFFLHQSITFLRQHSLLAFCH
jgi:hypothetical protein